MSRSLLGTERAHANYRTKENNETREILVFSVQQNATADLECLIFFFFIKNKADLIKPCICLTSEAIF